MNFCILEFIYVGDDESSNLSKVQFGRIVDGKLVYDEGKNDHFVFQGMTMVKP